MQSGRRKIYYLFVFTFSLLCVSAYSQSYYFRNYSVEDGLPFVEVSAIFQDHNGNLWSGGYGGLSKFDGVSFANYTPKSGLLNHSVTCITEDKEGNLWVGTIAGINKFDGNKFASYTIKDGLPDNLITAAFKDSENNVWFGTDRGIAVFRDGVFTKYTTKNGLINDTVNTFFQDKKGNVWIGTAEGLCSYAGGKFTNYETLNKSLQTDGMVNVNGFAEDNEFLYVATTKGLIVTGKTQVSIIGSYIPKECKGKNITSILKDSRNNIWLGTPKGLIKYDGLTFSKVSVRITQNSNIIHNLFEDYEHNLWIGTSAGLFKYRGNPFVSYGINDGLTSNFIYGIVRDKKNNLWIGSQGGGLYKYSNNQIVNYNEDFGLKAKTVTAIYENKPGELWLATDEGLWMYDGKLFTKKKDTSKVFHDQLNCIYKDSKNNIWIGGNNELFKYDGKEFQRYTFKCRNENYQVWDIVEDKSGTIWIGTYLGGLIKYDGNTFTECSEQIGFNNDSFLASLIDKEGNIYFGCLDGVWIYNPATPNVKPVNFNQSDGMSSDLVYCITFGKKENELWAGTNQGLNQINISEYKKSGKKLIIPFGKQEGFTGVECNSNGTWVDDDGAIWFGTVYGLVKYDPNEYIENKAESKISITGFSLFYNDTILKNGVHLSHYDNSITFNYSGICLTNPAKVKYSYILEGFEKTWSPPTAERSTNYSNLPPGTYTFKVISSNNENVWNQVPATFTFTIDIPYWKTWWFIASLSVLIILILYLSVRFRIRQIKTREKLKTEMNKKIANIESQALRSQMNPHFIFNTMSSIQHYISNNDSDAAMKYLSKFAKLMRKIMDNSKQQVISVSEELDALNLYLELEVMRFDKKFEYIINVDKSIDQNYEQIPSMLIQPYIENAIIHGLLPKDGNGKISITLLRQGDTILCTIEDNGIGRKNSLEFKKNRVQQYKSMGMNITQERLDILNSSLKSNIFVEIIDLYNNGEPSGTKVNLTIPIETN